MYNMTAAPGKKSKFERFHGAFTGGFSAGYFNTVGSENNAGFQPSTFVSSRSSRASVDLVTSRKEHYMDDEDGLLGGHLSTKQDTDSFNKKGSAYNSESDSRIIPGPLPSDLIIVPVDSVGKKLLASMGWKQGHGVGPMQRRRISEFSETELATIPKSSMQNGFILFPASRDSEGIKLEMPTPKTDLVGLGYDIANENPEMLEFIRSKNRTTKHKGDDTMHIQVNTYRVDDLFNKRSSKSSSHLEGAKYSSGFAYDEDVDEVYEGAPDRGSYLNHELTEDDVLEQADSKESSLLRGVNAWLGETIEGDVKVQQRSYDGRNPLPGFHVSKDEKIVPPVINRIEVPANFSGKHVFATESMGTQVESSGLLRRKKLEGGLAVVAARATILNNNSGFEADAKSGSIFDMLSVDDQQRIKNITQTGKELVQVPATEQLLATSVSVAVVQSSSIAPVAPATAAERPMLTSASLLNSTFAGLSQAFRNRFVTSTGSSSLPENIVKEGMATSAEYTAKISATIASSSSSSESKKEKDNNTISAKPKTFHVVRNTTIWAPAPLLCKRFNIKTPEISKDFAAINAKQDDGGIFDRLFPGSDPPAVVAEKSDEAKDCKAVDEELLQQFEKQDAYRPVAEKPPVSLFKSIFLDDSDSESDSEADHAAVEEVAAPAIDRNQTDSLSSETAPDWKREFIAPVPDRRDSRIPERVSSSADSVAAPPISRDESSAATRIISDFQPAKVSFVSKKDRLQSGNTIVKGSGNLTFGSASFRPGKQKKTLLLSEEPQDENKEEPSISVRKEVESRTVGAVIEDDRDEASMKRRKHHQLNSNKRKTATLSFDSADEDPADDTMTIIRRKPEAKLSTSIEPPLGNLYRTSMASATESTIGNISAATDRQMKPLSTVSDPSSSTTTAMEEKAQRRKNEAQANQFLAALLSKHTVHGDPDLDVPLPSYLTDAPPRPAGSRIERPTDSTAQSGHGSKDRRREQNGSSSMSNSYYPPRPPPVPSSADHCDDTEPERKAPSFAALSQRLKAELDDKSRRKEEKKKHKEKKDKKDKKDSRKKRSGSDSD